MLNENQESNLVNRFPVIAFVLLTFSLTWGIKLLYAFCKSKYGIPVFNFGLLASFGPFFSAFLLIAVSEGKQGIINTLRKMSCLRIGIKWILIAALFEPLMFLSITLGYWIAYGEFPSSIDFLFFPSITSYLITFVSGLFRWGVSEEIGWRGWMLPKLQITMSPIKASLILALFASLWHLDPNK
ncbi:MAG: CPBP family intramembrane metalloprotease, partial [Bacteroidales bacterium]|nr:CPBP family intramembrane metalloprotease [Bacteroidales bacterium]